VKTRRGPKEGGGELTSPLYFVSFISHIYNEDG
jgi:hypothetical protein